MPSDTSSVIIGTSGLAAAALASLWLALSRRAIPRRDVSSVRRLAILGLLLQVAHFAEEWLGGFHLRFPQLLGLAPWPAAFFTWFNLGWAAVWVGAIALLATHPRIAVFPIWFLGIASAANGVAHPLLALATGGYFPGLWTSPAVGIVGVVLLRALAAATGAGGPTREGG